MLTDLVNLAASLSPVALGILAIAYVFKLAIKSKEKRLLISAKALEKDAESTALGALKESIKEGMCIKSALDGQAKSIEELKVLGKEQVMFGEKACAHLEKMGTQLVLMNAKQSSSINDLGQSIQTSMPHSTQRDIIRHYVEKGIDDMYDVIKHSIKRNNIKGREEEVVDNLFRALTVCSDGIITHLEAIDGLTYEYQRLMEEHLPRIWVSTIRDAMPLYKRTMGIDAMLDGLEEIKLRLSHNTLGALASIFERDEDPENGAVYKIPSETISIEEGSSRFKAKAQIVEEFKNPSSKILKTVMKDRIDN